MRRGPRLHGVVLPGGSDWQTIGVDGLVKVFAHYMPKADDGTVIEATALRARVASADATARMAKSEDVPPDAYCFRTTPRFAVAVGPHVWLRRTVFVGRAFRRPNHTEIPVFAVE